MVINNFSKVINILTLFNKFFIRKSKVERYIRCEKLKIKNELTLSLNKATKWKKNI